MHTQYAAVVCMIVKICGLRTIEHARVAAALGADLIGLVFAASRRRISPAEGAAIVNALHAQPGPQPLVVGLFVNSAPEVINTVGAQVGLDLVQLSGDEPVAYAESIQLPVIKAMRMDGSPSETEWQTRAAGVAVDQPRRIQASPRLLIDAHVPGTYGGTGLVADWTRAAHLAGAIPLMLAGGLTPQNVAAAIAQVRPWGVDVSSGVECNGAKDPRQIEAFIAAARAASSDEQID
jgi:phosphoribosylanthranilate isomerase